MLSALISSPLFIADTCLLSFYAGIRIGWYFVDRAKKDK